MFPVFICCHNTSHDYTRHITVNSTAADTLLLRIIICLIGVTVLALVCLESSSGVTVLVLVCRPKLEIVAAVRGWVRQREIASSASCRLVHRHQTHNSQIPARTCQCHQTTPSLGEESLSLSFFVCLFVCLFICLCIPFKGVA